jgi:hypothetical protein
MTGGAKLAGGSVDTKAGAATHPATNTERLRVHLTKSGLAIALLSAWAEGPPSEARNRMLTVLHEFHKSTQAAHDPTTAHQD